jgi:transposase
MPTPSTRVNFGCITTNGRLMTHPGVGAITALAYAWIIGTPERFHRGKQIATYQGMRPHVLKHAARFG